MKRGFTYIEMLVIVSITVILAGLVAPNVLSDKRQRKVWEFRSRVEALGKEARSRAIQTGEQVGLIYKKEPATLALLQQTSEGTPVELRSLPVPDEVTAGKFLVDQTQGAGEEWIVPFYADGTSAGGGIEFNQAGKLFYVTVAKTDAVTQVRDGPLPDLALETWRAGDYVRR